VHVMFN
jgi:hypothetical protein